MYEAPVVHPQVRYGYVGASCARTVPVSLEAAAVENDSTARVSTSSCSFFMVLLLVCGASCPEPGGHAAPGRVRARRGPAPPGARTVTGIPRAGCRDTRSGWSCRGRAGGW